MARIGTGELDEGARRPVVRTAIPQCELRPAQEQLPGRARRDLAQILVHDAYRSVPYWRPYRDDARRGARIWALIPRPSVGGACDRRLGGSIKVFHGRIRRRARPGPD